jgi:hypothetical protein
VAALIADGRDIAVSEAVMAALEAQCAEELADLRALLAQTLATPGATLASVLATLEREFFQG